MNEVIDVLLIGISDNQIESIKEGFKKEGLHFRLVLGEKEKIIAQQLLNSGYRFVFIEADFLKKRPQIKQTLLRLPMETRRNQLFILIDSKVKTLSHSSAFKNGVNAVINAKDLAHFPHLMHQIIGFDNELYGGFKKRLEKFMEVEAAF